MRLNLGVSFQGRPLTMENGFQNRVALWDNYLSSKFFALKSKRTIALWAIPRALAATVNQLAINLSVPS